MKLSIKEISSLSNIIYQVHPKSIRVGGYFVRFADKINPLANEYAPKINELNEKMNFINGFLNQNKPKENEVKSDIYLKKELELKELRKQLSAIHNIEIEVELSTKDKEDVNKIIDAGFDAQLISFQYIKEYLDLSSKLN